MYDWHSTWQDLARVDLAFLPVGSVEQHGPHLPVGTDGMIAGALARDLARGFENAYVLPLLPFSSSFEHAAFPGSISLRVTTLVAVVDDILASLWRFAVPRCVIITGHQGNHFLRNVVQETNAGASRPRTLLLPSRRHFENAYRAAGLTSSVSADMHAGEGETSIIMHLAPETVRPGRSDVDVPERMLLEVLGMRAYTAPGHIGFPSLASAEKGAALLRALVTEMGKTVCEFIAATD